MEPSEAGREGSIISLPLEDFPLLLLLVELVTRVKTGRGTREDSLCTTGKVGGVSEWNEHSIGIRFPGHGASSLGGLGHAYHSLVGQ